MIAADSTDLDVERDATHGWDGAHRPLPTPLQPQSTGPPTIYNLTRTDEQRKM